MTDIECTSFFLPKAGVNWSYDLWNPVSKVAGMHDGRVEWELPSPTLTLSILQEWSLHCLSVGASFFLFNIYLLLLMIFLKIFTCLTLFYMFCTRDLRFSWPQAGSLVVAWELLVAAGGIWFPDQGLNPGPLLGSTESQPLEPGKSWMVFLLDYSCGLHVSSGHPRPPCLSWMDHCTVRVCHPLTTDKSPESGVAWINLST